VAWPHANLFGTFEFNEATTRIDIDALAARYADPACRGQGHRGGAGSAMGLTSFHS